MITITPTTGPLGEPAVAGVASLVAAMAGMATITEEQHLEGVGLVDHLAFRRRILPRWMGIVSVGTMAIPLGFALLTALTLAG